MPSSSESGSCRRERSPVPLPAERACTTAAAAALAFALAPTAAARELKRLAGCGCSGSWSSSSLSPRLAADGPCLLLLPSPCVSASACGELSWSRSESSSGKSLSSLNKSNTLALSGLAFAVVVVVAEDEAEGGLAADVLKNDKTVAAADAALEFEAGAGAAGTDAALGGDIAAVVTTGGVGVCAFFADAGAEVVLGGRGTGGGGGSKLLEVGLAAGLGVELVELGLGLMLGEGGFACVVAETAPATGAGGGRLASAAVAACVVCVGVVLVSPSATTGGEGVCAGRLCT